MGKNNTCPVSDLVDETGGEQVDQKLQAEIDGDKQRDTGKRDPVGALESQKQKRCKVIHNGLHDIADEAGGKGSFIRVMLCHVFLRPFR